MSWEIIIAINSLLIVTPAAAWVYLRKRKAGPVDGADWFLAVFLLSVALMRIIDLVRAVKT